jgi:hypothetical protein
MGHSWGHCEAYLTDKKDPKRLQSEGSDNGKNKLLDSNITTLKNNFFRLFKKSLN